MKARYDAACQSELGKALAAEKMITVKLLRLGATCAMTGTLFDLRSETTEQAATTRTGSGESDLLGGVDSLVEQLGR